MVAFVISEECTRCGEKTEGLAMLALPPIKKPKKKGKTITFSYGRIVYLCAQCMEDLEEWMWLK